MMNNLYVNEIIDLIMCSTRLIYNVAQRDSSAEKDKRALVDL